MFAHITTIGGRSIRGWLDLNEWMNPSCRVIRVELPDNKVTFVGRHNIVSVA